MKKIIGSAIALALGFSTFVNAQDVNSSATKDASSSAALEELLVKVREGRVSETAEHRKREVEFQSRKNQQTKMLSDAEAEQNRLERLSDKLEKDKRNNDDLIGGLLVKRRDELGRLQELFGVLQQAGGDMRSVIAGSHVSIDNTERAAEIDNLITKVSNTNTLPNKDEINTLPAQMMLEMVESRKVVTFDHEVKTTKGTPEIVSLTRIGDFTLMSGDKFYVLKPGGSVQELPRQPSGRYTDSIGNFQDSTSGLVNVGIDATRGQILSMEVDKPDFRDRLEQGGPIGYLILALGFVGVLMAIFQWFYLFTVSRKVKAQIRSDQPSLNNCLGRVLSVYYDNTKVDVETLELKLDEAILKETPTLERFLNPIKLISAVAPLFGLLGTVVGMIETFQAITLFGTGDPKMMAAGISTALMTTVEGLVVAIPTLLIHSFVAGSSKTVIHILEEQSAGIIAVHAEKENAHA
jgi:biopolymer transport protein ExbB